MKQLYIFLLFLCSAGVTAQGTLVSANLDGTTEFPFTFLDIFVEANNGATGSDNLYLLERGGSYFFTSRATWDFNVEFRATGDENLPHPVISRVNLTGDPPQDMYRGFGNLTFDGIHLIQGDEGAMASQYETASIRPSGDNTRFIFRNSIIEKDRQAVLRVEAQNVKIYFESCEVRNLGDYEGFQGNGRVVDTRQSFADSVVMKDCYIHNLLDRVFIGFRQTGLNYFEFTGNTVYNHIGRHGLIQLNNTKETIIKNNLFINPSIQGSTPSLANEQKRHLLEQIYLFTIDTIVEGATIDMTNNNVFWNQDVLDHYASIDTVDQPNVLSPLFAAQLANPDSAFFTEVLELNNVPSRTPLITYARESVATRASSGLTNIMVEDSNDNQTDNPYEFDFTMYDPCFSTGIRSGSAATDGGALGARWACDYVLSARELIVNTSLNLKASPNPANVGTTLSYQTFASGPVQLHVYDVQGRRMTTLVDAVQPVGVHSVDFNGMEALPGGVYFANLLTSSGRMFIRIVKN